MHNENLFLSKSIFVFYIKTFYLKIFVTKELLFYSLSPIELLVTFLHFQKINFNIEIFIFVNQSIESINFSCIYFIYSHFYVHFAIKFVVLSIVWCYIRITELFVSHYYILLLFVDQGFVHAFHNVNLIHSLKI